LRLLELRLLLLETGVLRLLVRRLLRRELGHDVVLAGGVFVRAVEGAAELRGRERRRVVCVEEGKTRRGGMSAEIFDRGQLVESQKERDRE
jgi:hypothetical protein